VFDLGWIAVKRLAGHGAQPVARDIGAALTTPDPTATQKSILWSVFEGAVPRELGALAENAGVSIYDIARDASLSRATCDGRRLDQPVGRASPPVNGGFPARGGRSKSRD